MNILSWFRSKKRSTHVHYLTEMPEREKKPGDGADGYIETITNADGGSTVIVHGGQGGQGPNGRGGDGASYILGDSYE